MRKYILVIFLLAAASLSACVPAYPQEDSFIIIATLFPQYDFARQVAGEKADVHLLLPPGVESHAYEPSPSDIIAISNADIFIYTGEYMESWAHRIAESIEGDVLVLDVSEGLTLDIKEHADEHEDEHDAIPYDPHIWTDPVMAITMAKNIEEALCTADPANAMTYKVNADAYIAKLELLDSDFKKLMEESKRNKIYFGGRFAMSYFAKRYGIRYEAAFDSCSSETEPSAQRVALLIDEMKAAGAPVIFYEELADPKIARTISEAVGAQMLLLHSCHNLSPKELESGETYISLMRQNLTHLKTALN